MAKLLPPGSHKSPIVAGSLSIIPGLGQLYIGQKNKGVALLASNLLIFYIFVLLAIITIPVSIIDAVVLCRRGNRGQTIRPWDWFWSRSPRSPEAVWKLAAIREMGRMEHPIGTDSKVLDNSRSDSTLSRSLKVSKEWSYTYSIEHEHVRRTVDTTSINIRDGGQRSKTVEEALQDRFGYVEGTKHIYEENVEVVAPPRTKVTVLFHWKKILDTGVIVLKNQFLQTVEIPFYIVIGVTFDQEHFDGTV